MRARKYSVCSTQSELEALYFPLYIKFIFICHSLHCIIHWKRHAVILLHWKQDFKLSSVFWIEGKCTHAHREDDEMQRKLKRSAVENWEKIKTSTSGFIASKTEMEEGGREGGWSWGATPLSRRGIPLLQWSAFSLSSFASSPPSMSTAPFLPPSAFPHTHSLSFFISFPLFLSLSLSLFLFPFLLSVVLTTMSAYTLTPLDCLLLGTVYAARVETQAHLWLTPFYSSLHLSLLLPCCSSIYPHILSTPPSLHTSFSLFSHPRCQFLSFSASLSHVTLIPRLLCYWLLLHR